MNDNREFLRHTLATVAYRGAKTLRGAPAEFASFRVGPGSRTPLEILAHVGDLFDWAHSLAVGEEAWSDAVPGTWEAQVERFSAGLARLDGALLSLDELACPAERLFQGPIADALWHIGQLAMLRRLAGSPIRGENYFRAEIERGRLGIDQAPPRREFD